MYQVGYDKERKFWWYCYVGADRVFVFVIVECVHMTRMDKHRNVFTVGINRFFVKNKWWKMF